jgi:hypothetical protein
MGKIKEEWNQRGGSGSLVLTGIAAEGRQRLRGLELHDEQHGDASVKLREGKCRGGRGAS